MKDTVFCGGWTPPVRLRIAALLLWGVISAAPVLAQGAAPVIHKVEVFAVSATPLNVPNKPAYPLAIYRTDELEQAQRALLAPAGTGRNDKETESLQAAYLREQGKAVLRQLAPLVSRHYQVEQLARRYAIAALPAIVINGSKVIYDVTDVDRAVAIFQKLQGD